MKHAQTIAMARGLLAEGRAADVARMIEPLLTPLDGDGPGAWMQDPSPLILRTLLARVRLLRNGNAPKVLDLLGPFESLIGDDRFDAHLRAEVALWLGWAHAWQDATTFDDARALNLLDKAERLFHDALDAHGRCWTLLGQAQAYFTIDEYQLMKQALEEAAALEETLQDAEASRWLHDLSVTVARFQGRYTQALTHTEMLADLGRRHDDPLATGRALAYQATLDFDRGRPPEEIIETAIAAETAFSGSIVEAGYPLLAAHRAHIRALLCTGRLDEADRRIDEAMAQVHEVPGARGYILKQRARLWLIRGEYERARTLLDDLLGRMHRLQHQLLAAAIALVAAETHRQQGDFERAVEWAERAHRSARETGHVGQQLEALFLLACLEAERGNLDEARRFVAETERHSGFFSVLPFAALRFHTLGHLARAEHHPGEARTFFAQALSAYSLIGDAYHTARIQLELAELGRTTDPVRNRPLLDAAVLTFEQLRARPDLAIAQTLLTTWPREAQGTTESFETTIGAALAQAALSVDLVAETWLRTAARLLPGRWLAVYRHDARHNGRHEERQDARPGEAWQRVRARGEAPEALTFPDPAVAETQLQKVRWVRMRGRPDPVFFFGIETSGEDPAWDVAQARFEPWLPVVTLALDHALLQASRLDTARASDANADGEPELSLEGFHYASPAMRKVVRQVHRIRASHSAVLITGESGTGKELIARAVHATSERKNAPFMAFNCSTVPHELFESHLFGHEKGAFTGAVRAHPGVIRMADGGTLFLDEIGDLPLDVQPKLLRFLQEGEVFPLGAKRPIRVNVRIVAATNQDLELRIREGRFREDLYYRLNVIPLRVPPLRERREEVPLLVRHFLADLRPGAAPLASITNRALDALLRYDWPGNVRQLRNEIERALVYAGSEPAPLVDLDDLSPAVVEAEPADEPSAATALDQILRPEHTLEALLAETEKRLIECVLADTSGHVTASAEVLGLTRQGLYKKMKRLGIEPARFHGDDDASEHDPLLHLN